MFTKGEFNHGSVLLENDLDPDMGHELRIVLIFCTNHLCKDFCSFICYLFHQFQGMCSLKSSRLRDW